jgi:hypothetical protein
MSAEVDIEEQLRASLQARARTFALANPEEPPRDFIRSRPRQRRHSAVTNVLVVAAVAAVVALALVFGPFRSGMSGVPSTTPGAHPSSPVSVPKGWGTLVGTLGVYGGMATAHSCGCVMEEGTVRLSQAHGAPIVVNVAKSGKFSVRVPVGRYTVQAGTHGATNWPMGSCRMLLVADKPGGTPTTQKYLTVLQSETTHVVVGCQGM